MTSKKNDLVEEIVGMAEIGVGEAMEKVLARITFPKRWSDRPTVVLNPTPEQFRALSYMGGRQLSFVLRLGSEEQQTTIETDGLWILRSNQTYWSEEVQECRIEAEANGVWKKRFRAKSNGSYGRKTNVRFWISPNKALHGFGGIEMDFNGNRVMEAHGHKKIDLSAGLTLTFCKNYYWWSEEGIESATNYVLVANADLDMPSSEFFDKEDGILKDLQLFLLVVSLATRTRTACYGWDVSADDGWYTRYLPDVSIPTGYSEPSFNDGLIGISDFESFYRRAYMAFVASKYKDSIVAAIYALTPLRERFLESDFIAVFSALEQVLLIFRRAEGIEYALPEEEWKHLRGRLEKVVKETVSEKDSREKIKAKMLDLNRVPLSYAYNKFIEEIRVDVSDLWPVFNRENGVTLSYPRVLGQVN
jgi:hypothetical protein